MRGQTSYLFFDRMEGRMDADRMEDPPRGGTRPTWGFRSVRMGREGGRAEFVLWCGGF
jgi:hypothetical protein